MFTSQSRNHFVNNGITVLALKCMGVHPQEQMSIYTHSVPMGRYSSLLTLANVAGNGWLFLSLG